MVYGTVYGILERFLDQGLVTRQERTTPKGRIKFYYGLTKRGRGVAERVLRYMPNPVEALTAWLVQDDPSEGSSAPSQVKPGVDRSPGPCSRRYREVGDPFSTAVSPRISADLVKGSPF